MCTDFGTGPPFRGPSHFPVVSREGGKGWTRRVWWEEGSEECCQVCPFVCGQVGSDLEGPTFGVQVHRPKPRRSHNYLHQPGELCTISFDACSRASDGWSHCPKWRIPSSGRLLAQLSPQPSNTPTFSGEPPSSTSCQHHTSMLSWRWRPWEEKGNTVVMMFEACLGVGTAENIRHKRRNDQCNDCYLRDSCAKRFKTTEGNMTVACDARPVPLSACQAHNTKNNSYLTKFVLSVLPNDFYKFGNALEVVLTKICEDFRYLFEEGVSVHNKPWFLGLTGLKGDLKWYEKIANLHRCFNKQCGAGLQMCHECEAGTPQYPWEDGSHHPVWGNVLYQSRPWNQTPIIVNIPFEPPGGAPEKILRRDLFHNTKVGLLRDFVASSILLLIFLGYFKDGRPGVSNKIDVCLERAHRSFYLFCRTTQSKAGLRSFTPTFLNYKKSTCYGWINAKGSDVTLLIKWLCVWVGGLLNDPLDPEHVPTLRRIYLGAMCVKTWQNILYSHGCWLHRHCGMVVYQEFHEFLQHYNWLAFICLTKWHFTGYGMKSKFHMIAHAKLDLANLLDQTDIQWVPSPLLFSRDEWGCGRKACQAEPSCGLQAEYQTNPAAVPLQSQSCSQPF